MGKDSTIEWTDHTFNGWWGCFKVSPGCAHCYADTLATRYGHNVWGPAKTTDRRTFGEKHWAEPLKWNKAAAQTGRRARVFCSSMADVFEEHPALNAERAKLWELIEATPWLDWLLLTKRPENMVPMAPASWAGGWPDNVWAMTSVENQEYADKRIPALLRVPARVRGLSCEPLLGPVDLSPWLICERCKGEGQITETYNVGRSSGWFRRVPCPACEGKVWRRDLHWVIVGGESGPKARPMHPTWARSLREQCRDAGVAFHFKQWGDWHPDCLCATPRPHTQTPRPQPGGIGVMFRCGKHAGRLLDGREWNEVPG